MPISFPEYESFDGLGLASLIKTGAVSPQEVLEAAIERLERWNPKLNAVIHKMYEDARQSIRKKSTGVFSHVPILLKDLLAEVKGVPISYGSRFVYNHKWVSIDDSEVVKRLKKSGAIILGKTNVPEFGLSPSTEPTLHGPTRNPWDLTRSPGGSSGGSAAAVAARIVPIAHGGDGGGSLRIPAAYTGVFGFKPSRGRTPVGPFVLRVWQGMVVENAITRTVRDCAGILDVLSGPELGSPISLPKVKHNFLSQLEHPLQKLKIAVITEPFFSAEVDAEYAKTLQKAAVLCKELGHDVSEINLKIENNIPFAFLILMAAETAVSIQELSKNIGKKPKSNELEKQNAIFCYVGKKLNSADYAAAIKTLDRVQQKLAKFFKEYDVIMTLTTPFPAPKIGDLKLKISEQFALSILPFLPFGKSVKEMIRRASEKSFSFMSFTGLFNIGGQPAMSVPLFSDSLGMPIGIQFATKFKNDLLLLQFAHQLEKAKPWIDVKPKLI